VSVQSRPRKIRPTMTVEEISEETGMTVGAVNMTISRALRKLRQQKLLLTARELATELDRGRKGTIE
jgi:hypothetical protein